MLFSNENTFNIVYYCRESLYYEFFYLYSHNKKIAYFMLLTTIAAIMTIITIINKKSIYFKLISSVALIIYMLLIFFYMSACIPHARGPQPPQVVQDTDIANLYIRTSIELPVIKGQSIHIKTFIFVEEMPKDSDTIQYGATPIPIGTPKVPIKDAFGGGYTVSAKAQLDASAFNLDPHEQQEQSLDQTDYVTFPWTATPMFTGKQALEVIVTGVWTPKEGGVPIERPLAGQSFSLNVTEQPSSFISLGQIDFGTLLGVLLGSALNIPWIVELVKKIRGKRQKKGQNHSTKKKNRRKLKK